MVTGEDPICPSCLLAPYPFRRLRSLFEYSEVAETLIKSFKYDGRREIGQGFVQIVHEALEPNHPRYSVEQFRNPIFPRAEWDLVIPLPSSRSTLKTRGFSHMTLLTAKLGKMLRLPAPKFALSSRRTRRAQVELSPDARWKNMSHAFIACESQVKNRTILLIDDVITTGASLSAATLALRKSGALVVDILTLARSKQFHRHRLRQLTLSERI